MSTSSGLTNPHSEVSRGRTRTRRFSGQSDSGLPPSGFGMRQRQGSISSLISNKSGNELIQGLEEYRIRNREDLSREQIEAQREKQRLEQLMSVGENQSKSSTKDRIRDLEAQLDETLAGLRMEKALVSGELAEEESMFEMEREQLSDVTRDQHSSGQHEIIRELQTTIKDRGRRIDALKNQMVALDHEIREETLRLNAERDEQIIALQREEKVAASRFQRKTPSYCTGPRTRRRARSQSGYTRDNDCGSSILSVDSYGSTANSNWVLERASQIAGQPGDNEHHVEEMKRLLLEVQQEKERLIRSLAAGSVENMLSPTAVGSTVDPLSPLSTRQTSDSVFEQSIVSPIKDSIPQSSSQSISDIGASASQYGNEVTLRSSISPDTRPKENRPMTRYLPNASGTLDLKLHLESLGHSPNLLNSLVLTSNNLRGQLTKLASRKKRRPWQRWQNRWILFDRVTRSLQWFSDKHEKKPNGVIFFPDIQDVYLDHQNKHKAPNRRIGIVIIASSRRLVLAAKTPESARIWVDAIVTGCEGNKQSF